MTKEGEEVRYPLTCGEDLVWRSEVKYGDESERGLWVSIGVRKDSSQYMWSSIIQVVLIPSMKRG